MSTTTSRRQAIRNLALFLAGTPLLEGQYSPRATHPRVPSLEEMANVFEFEPVAYAKLERLNYDYVAGGVEDEVTLRRNRKAFDWATLLPRAMRAVEHVDLSATVLGQPMSCPLLVAPTGGQVGVHPEGDVEMHRGASAAGCTMGVSFVATFPPEQIAAAAPGPLWQQIYIHLNPTRARERVDQAAALGYKAVLWTVDAQYSSLRERLRHDANLGARSASPREEQSRAQRRRGRRSLPESPYRINRESPDQSWDFLSTVKSWSELPVLVKGLLTAEDARLAVESGADGIVVSNHGARYLSHCPSTFEVLPEMVDAVAGRIPVLVDGGFRRGGDILKALALGADAVLVGRPPLWGLGAFGAAGAQRVLEILQAELRLAMAGCGVSRIADIDRSLVQTDFP
jgi:isopentenyl diphosphate isomerase/L-lactate dehydrogenase-like FMN-dependent dehydrogenase